VSFLQKQDGIKVKAISAGLGISSAVDENNKICYIQENLEPWKQSMYVRKAKKIACTCVCKCMNMYVCMYEL
jgi:hypothetical protein